MRYFILTILFLVGLVLQSTLFSHLTLAGMKPDIVLIFIILYAILHGPKEGALAGIIGGLLQDLLFGQNIGLNIMSKIIVGYLAGLLDRRIYKENLIIPVIVVFLGSLVNDISLYLFRLAADISTGDFIYIREIIFYTALYNSILTLFVYRKFYASSQKGLLRIRR